MGATEKAEEETVGIAADEGVVAQPGAVAALIQRYLSERGMSKRRLARDLRVDISKVQSLARGFTYGGTRYLGAQTRGQAEVPFVRRVAEALAIPDSELEHAVALDLGIVGAVSPTISPSGFSPDLPANVFEIARARRAREAADVIALPVRTAG